MLLSLPAVLVNSVLCDWLRVADIGRLDSAHCERKERPKLLEIFQSPHFITDVLLPSNIEWMISRDLRAKAIGKNSHFDWQMLSQYMSMYADSCQEVHISSRTPEQVLSIFVTHCKRLLSLTANKAGPVVGQLLQNNPQLQEFDFNSTGNGRDFDFSQFAFPKVHTLSACVRGLDVDEVLDMYGMFPNVLKLHISCLDSTFDRLAARVMVQMPQLRTLNMQACYLSGAVLAQSVALCPHIVHLDVRNNEGIKHVYEGVDDAAVLSAACGLKLRSIAFSYHVGITSRTFEFLASHCFETLQEVCVTHLVTTSRKRNCLNNTKTVSRESIEQLKQACGPKMKFTWQTNTHHDIATYFHLPHSTSLIIVCPVTDVTLHTISQECWQLRELYVQPNQTLFTESGLREFIQTCDQLQTICVYHIDKQAVLPAFAADFPGLFSLDPRSEPFDCMKMSIV